LRALRPQIQGAPTSRYAISARRRNKEDGGAAPQPFGRRGVAVDPFVARRRRCPSIASFSLLDLASQAPSANITVLMEGSTMLKDLLILSLEGRGSDRWREDVVLKPHYA